MSLHHYPKVSTNGLELYLDSGNTQSYPGYGDHWINLSKGTITGSLKNGATFDTSSKSINFDGVNQYVQVDNLIDLSTTNQCTVTVWCKSNTVNWNANGMVISRRDQFLLHPSSGSKTMQCYIHTNQGFQNRAYAPEDIQSEFNDYTMTYDSGSLVAYFNGDQVTAGPIGSSMSSDTNRTTIGWDDGVGGRYGEINVAIAMVYSRALSSGEVNQNYRSLRERIASQSGAGLT